MPGKPLLEKGALMRRLINDEYFLVHLNTANESLLIPDYLKENGTVTLKLSRLFRGGIDLKESHIETSLLFNNEYADCLIPFEAIWGITSCKGENTIWPEDTPKEILKNLLSKGEDDKPPSQPKAGKPSRPKLKRVK
ncbi:MAG: hypothetical protein J5J00_14750 [Deltaproteobacteria bacterium]|nr:hypothetical protein [Deltaproteobacteria bacterium]